MRPAGALISNEDGFFLPLQGTRSGKYGECLALSLVVPTKEHQMELVAFEFVQIGVLCPEFVSSHHFAYFRQGSMEVFVIDGQTKQSDWEVRVFASSDGPVACT
jgi:hypothetical protein